MWPSLISTTTVADYESSRPDSVSKDGRKIYVGDCALFKPPQDSPPFIGIIRRLTVDSQDSLKLSVNWLYRPADLELGEGILLDAAPNEVFYSFHKDEISAASLLHPCKVSFLRKSVELPPGISSFVCRRVYDTEDKCLWWLTDKDYIKGRKEEVGKLLDKTQLNMHGTAQSGGRSPKSLNGPSSMQQLKSGSDNLQNSTSFFSHVKGKKRERGDQGSDPIKRERVSKTDDDLLKSEISKITDKEGLEDLHGVEKLVQLIQSNSAGKKIDLVRRKMLMDVIAVTDQYDCLEHFVQLKGLRVLDEWLQEVHKGKIGDGSSPKENDKSVDEYLFTLLRALDKLPVNLHALQTCNIGKSVNHLRSHKNSEIQRKARSLVDTWKKRVEAEMNMNYEKSSPRRSVSWPTKQATSEVSNAGNRKAVGYSDVSPKISVSHQSVPKASQVKFGSGDSATKSNLSPTSTKSLTGSVGAKVKDSHLRASAAGGSSDLPLTAIKVEKSNSSSQSQNNSHSYSSDHAKTVGSCRSTAGSVSVNKLSSGSSRHRKSSNGIPGSVVKKEAVLGKVSASNRKLSSEKASSFGVTRENAPDVLHVESENSQRLILRLPNSGRSPNRGGAGACFEDTSVKDIIETHDNHDRRLKEKSDVLRVCSVSNMKAELCDSKDGLTLLVDGNGLPQPDEQCGAGESGNKVIEESKNTNSSLGMVSRTAKSCEASLSSMNALIESCAKFSEVSASASPPGDDRGMNLLASVATGEICKSEDVSLSSSPDTSSPAPEESCSGNNCKLRQSGEEATQELCQPNDGANEGTTIEQGNSVDSSQTKDEMRNTTTSMSQTAYRGRPEEKTMECNSQLSYFVRNLQQNADDLCSRSNAKPADQIYDASGSLSSLHAKQKDNTEAEGSKLSNEQINPGVKWVRSSSISDLELKGGTLLLSEDDKVDDTEEKLMESSVAVALDVSTSMVNVETEVNRSSPGASLEKIDEHQNTLEKESNRGIVTDQKQSLLEENPHPLEDEVKDVDIHSGSSNVSMDSKADKVEGEKAGGRDLHVEKNDMDSCSSNSDQRSECAENSESSLRHFSAAPISHVESSLIPMQEKEPGEKTSEQKLNVQESQVTDESHIASGNLPVSATGSDTAVKLDFDLNEGFLVNDENQGEHDILLPVKGGTSSGVLLPSPSSFPASLVSVGLPASITVAAAAKGSFLPPENPLRIKGELGWKGSAATSAFRPAEPRRSMEMSLLTTDIHMVDPPSKQERPAFDFDLNVADERVLEDVASRCSAQVAQVTRSESGSLDRSAGGLDLDLNRVDDSPDLGPLAVNTNCGFDISYLSTRSSLTGVISNGGIHTSRGFDLNNGPGLDEVGSEAGQNNQHMKTNTPFQVPNPGVRLNNAEFGNFSSWFPPGNAYSAITAPPILPVRGDQTYVGASGSQRILGPVGSTVFAPELYRGPVLSSTPAMAYPSTTPYQYPGFPFETASFPLSSNSLSGCSTSYVESSSGGAVCYPTIPSQLVGHAGVVPSPFTRPFVMNLQGGTSSVAYESRKWGNQVLDLNAGPGTDSERRNELASSVVRQVSLPGPQALTEEQLKMFQMAGNVLKRKEPDGGWDAAFSYKQPSWQ